MSESPSPTSSSSPKTSSTTLHIPAASNQTSADAADIPARLPRPGIGFAGNNAPASGDGRRASIQFALTPAVRPLRSNIAFAAADAAKTPGDGRRASIQFAPSLDSATEVSRPAVPPLKIPRRMSSPPPPSTYESRVSFNTFDNKDATDISFTLVSKHRNYAYTRRSRTFLCGTDQNDYSEFALEWLVEELVEDGDEIVCLRVVDKDSKIASDPSVQQGIYKEEASSLLDSVKKKNEDGKAISLVLELAMGKVPETIQRMIQIYAPTCLIVGTRGRSLGGISGLLPGSVSKYCLQNSPVPVVVVRPEDKRDRKKTKRFANRSRQGYNSMLDNAKTPNPPGSGSDRQASTRVEASEGEAEAVAKAIGLNERALGSRDGDSEGAPLSRTTSVKSGAGTEDSPSPIGSLVIDDDGGGDRDGDGEEEDGGPGEVPEMELGSPITSEGEDQGEGGIARDSKDSRCTTKTDNDLSQTGPENKNS